MLFGLFFHFRLLISVPFSLALSVAKGENVTARVCADPTFASLKLPNAKVLSVNSVVAAITWPASSDLVNAFPSTKNGTKEVCQITVMYTHPGQNDTINTWVWLPLESWNGRFVGMGGSGWVTGTAGSLAQPVFEGYSAASTDGGHLASATLESWVLNGDGDINWPLLEDFSSSAVNEAALLGKAATKLFYSTSPKYSYFNGCSTGGRQGHMLAQQFPNQYDGVLAGSPAINWDEFIPAQYWPPLMMQELDYYPTACELDAITDLAINACDALDGVKDGIIAFPGLCHFDPYTMIGKDVLCDDSNHIIKLSSKSAKFAAAAWAGANSSDGSSLWYGVTHDATLTGLGGTDCSSGHCKPTPFFLSTDWIATILSQDPSLDLSTIDLRLFRHLFQNSVKKFKSIIGTRDPDLTKFKNAGGKMITWHGMKDQYAFYNGTVDYYNKVRDLDPRVHDYYRFFSAPGVEHCGGGPGWFPGDGLNALIDWVENGKAPDTLLGLATPTATENADEPTRTAYLCCYPKVLTYTKGDIDQATSFICR
ncbi:hypothetical protein PENPOL_c003G10413 [Penicillium polonicum]|uniref:Carboxylic ester hydrolase n=1 Tax=Penicillium polonicum TaxID=60169 RepID=A0A1V6NSK2_PENPO|nr:hypothetical protein PENPOL_c003G10413 [Penicillium polonicum]